MEETRDLPTSDMNWLIDQVCTEFESQWREGKLPKIEAFLDRVPLTAPRAKLLEELQSVEQELSQPPTVRVAKTLPRRVSLLRSFGTRSIWESMASS